MNLKTVFQYYRYKKSTSFFILILIISAGALFYFNKKSNILVKKSLNSCDRSIQFKEISQKNISVYKFDKNLKPGISKSRAVIVDNKFYLTRFSLYKNLNIDFINALKLIKNKKYKDVSLLLSKYKKNPYALFWKTITDFKLKNFHNVFNSLPKLRSQFFLLKDYFILLGLKTHMAKKDYENSLILAKILLSGSRKTEGLLSLKDIYKIKKKFRKEMSIISQLLNQKYINKNLRGKLLLRLAFLQHKFQKNQRTVRKNLLKIWTILPGSGLSVKANRYSKIWYKKPLKNFAACGSKIQRATYLSNINFHKKVVSTLQHMTRCSISDKCKFRYLKARSLNFIKKRKLASRLIGDAVFYCEKTKLLNYRVKSKYLAGKIALRRKKYRVAIKNFTRVYKEHPDHSYADDSIYKIALIHEIQKHHNKKIITLKKLLKQYPTGDKAMDAWWQIILDPLKKGDWKLAHALLQKSRSGLSPTPPFESWGRILYWLGRTSQLMGKSGDSIKFYKQCIAMAPATYHSLLALNRIEEISPGSSKAILSKQLNKKTPLNLPWSILSDTMFSNSKFARMIEFSRLGIKKEIKKEFKSIGLKIPSKYSAKLKHKNFYRAVSFIFYKSSLFSLSYALMGRVLYDYAYRWPAGNDLLLWKMAYPILFLDKISANSKLNKVPKNLILALIREESGFNPKIHSKAGAMGLAQIMPKTGKHLAKISKIPWRGKRSLLDPDYNIKLASVYLKRLGKMFNNRLIFQVGSYNAGEGAMKRWRKKSPNCPLDLFVEKIRVTETRNYIKRVISSYFTYKILNNDLSIPILHLR